MATTGRPIIDIEERFSRFVEYHPGQCWLWTGAVNKSGHGRFRLPDKTVYAVRWLWEYVFGPTDKDLCHTCDTAACVNLAHVYEGTAQSNSDDKFERRRERFLIGDKHPSTKVQNQEYQNIQRLYKEGVSVKEIAQRYGVHIMTIYRKLK